MKNYFKVFRFRKLTDAAGSERQLPIEKFVFFDDREESEVLDAAARARALRDEMAKKFSAIRISVFAPVYDLKAPIIGDFDLVS